MNNINILAIGNSFSEDATHYLHQIAKADKIDTKVVNLYIGGCSLERHWMNVEKEKQDYQYQLNGMITERYVSIRETLEEEKWDYVVVQQASCDSGWMESYEPFLELMIHYIRSIVPKTEILLHQTWAYELNSDHENYMRYHRSQKEMYLKLKEAYTKEAKKHQLKMLPCGEVIQKLRATPPFVYEDGGRSLCRDGFHMNYIYGRYLLAAVWYKIIFDQNICENNYIPKTCFAPDEKVDLISLTIIKECIDRIFNTID